MADRAPDESWERVARMGACALVRIDVLLTGVFLSVGEVIALPFVRLVGVRTPVRSNICSFLARLARHTRYLSNRCLISCRARRIFRTHVQDRVGV